VEVTDGLQPGELVITQGQIRVRPGQQVSIQAVDDGTRPLRDMVGEYEAEAPR
jgi:hypothetical protein